MTLTDELLISEEVNLIVGRLETPRTNLATTALELISTMSRFERTGPVSDATGFPLCVAFNQGALLQYHHGSVSRASELCHHSVRLYKELSLCRNDRTWLVKMIQPWINIGRIAGSIGQLSLSLRMFEAVYRFICADGSLEMDGVVLDRTARDSTVREDPTLDSVAPVVFIRDSIKAFLYARDFEGLGSFATAQLSSGKFRRPHLSHLLLEAKARALLGLHEYNESLRTLQALKELLRQDDRPPIGVLALIATVYRMGGAQIQARRILTSLERYADVMVQRGYSPLALANIRYLVALEQFAVDDSKNSEVNAQQALNHFIGESDEPGVLRSLMLLLRLAVETQASYAKVACSFHKLRTAAQGTLYRLERTMAYSLLQQIGPLPRPQLYEVDAAEPIQSEVVCKTGEDSQSDPLRSRETAATDSKNGPSYIHPDVNAAYWKQIAFSS